MQYMDITEQLNLLALVHLLTFKDRDISHFYSDLLSQLVKNSLINKDRDIMLQQNLKQK